MPKITGSLSVVKGKLNARMKQARSANRAVAVGGYTQSYSVYVHEDMDAAHAPGKTAKYLEIPLRENFRPILNLINDHYVKTLDLPSSLLIGMRYLIKLSQDIVPVDTGALKASAFAAMQEDVDAVAAAAFQASESIRLAAKGKR